LKKRRRSHHPIFSNKKYHHFIKYTLYVGHKEGYLHLAISLVVAVVDFSADIFAVAVGSAVVVIAAVVDFNYCFLAVVVLQQNFKLQN